MSHLHHHPKSEPFDSVSSLSSWSRSTAMPGVSQSALSQFQLADESDDAHEVTARSSRGSLPPRSGACVHCKSLKVRCEYAQGHSSCRRCETGNIQCLGRSRKKRKPAPTHEDLQEKAHDQDRQIQHLLVQFDKLKDEHKIQKWLARAHAYATPDSEYSREIETKMKKSFMNSSVAASVAAYFTNVSTAPGQTLPDIVRYGCLDLEDIQNLFELFFAKVNPFFSILDPALHTPENLIWTSPFLFTVICAVALRYCQSQRKLYHLAQDFARDAAGKALVEGSKSVDICQAYLLLAVYPVPKKKWTEDRSWLLMGVAIRMALELDLHHPPPPHCDKREALNRVRTWLNCYCVDGSHAIQFGKMPMLRLDDWMARTTQEWYKESPMNLPFDVHLCAYVQIILIMAQWRSLIGDRNLEQKIKDGFDIAGAAIETETRLSNELNLWVERYTEEYTLNPLQICAYRGNTTQMITAYLRLVVLASAFQHVVKSGISRDCDLLKRSIDAARMVIQIMAERLYPTGHLKFAMEANFLYVAFAAAYLVNLLRPKFIPLLDSKTQDDIIVTVSRLIEVLSSKDVVLDGRHTPALYSRFLNSLLTKYNIMERASCLSNSSPHRSQGYSSAPHTYWPDTAQTDSPPDREYPAQYEPDFVYQQSSNMDFSINHFVRTVSGQGIPQPTNYGHEYQGNNFQSWDDWGVSDNFAGSWSSHNINGWR
ncbi:hypothetical protein K435DRAFT_751881 [Dendrothele bispora CBS 962.96]|uniref:Zn(2)-C6 fungal-type domain-containing protein n=1 Tax=Dendrothele bispora (strain CBS 962.96) TaxID=1314807 RepID=A0A4S8MAK6_DENBC|nr:hypothetical protein K435DRAFT_751881 [Dendrothele bispora CBS 962.96]